MSPNTVSKIILVTEHRLHGI